MTTWRWECETKDGTKVAAPDLPVGFESQADAEFWLGEFHQDLLAAGVDQVRLFEAEAERYGPMSLHPA